MNHIINQLNSRIAAENPKYGEDSIDSILEMLHFYYTQANPINNEAIREGFREVRSLLEKLSPEEIDSLIYAVCDLCLKHENGEFERGKSRIIASADMLEFDDAGKRKKLSAEVFTAVDEAPEDVGITIFSPAFRDQSYLARKTEYLRNVENVIGLKRGLLSEVEAAERTATEVTSSEGDYNLTIIDFQQMWENALREAARLCGILGQMYHVPGAHDVDEDSIVVDWGNGVLFDEEKAWADYKDMVASGLLKPEIALGWKFNMPRDTPEQLREIREKYMPDAMGDSEDEE